MGGWVSSVFVLLSSIILDPWYVVRRSVGGWVSSFFVFTMQHYIRLLVCGEQVGGWMG